LLQKVWPDTAVEDGSLTWHISLLRKALEDGEGERRFIETLPRRGYRFVADVHAADPVRPAPSPHRRRTWHLWTAFACFALAAALVYLPISPGSPHVTLAVLPVQNLTGDAEQDFIADGLTDEIIAQLSRVNPERLSVIARTSAMAYKGSAKTVR